MSKSFIYGLGSALAGALIYGTWAYYVNVGDGAGMALMSALVQGSFSFCLTLSMSLLLTWLYNSLGKSTAAGVQSWLATCVFIFCTAYSLQYLAGSREILMTIAPGFLIGSIYAAVFLLSLHRGRTSADVNPVPEKKPEL